MTDEQNNKLVLKFAQQPAAEILAALKEGQFRYQAEYFGQRRVWIRRNDFEGRLLAEQIESQWRKTEMANSPTP
jgi:hypothetical protein